MPRYDELERDEDPKDRKKLEQLKSSVFEGKRIAATGFYQVMQAAREIKQTQLYKLDGYTWKDFCPQKLNLDYTTVVALLKINDVFLTYPDLLPKELLIEFGHKKMRLIAYGAVKIENGIKDSRKARSRVKRLLKQVSPEMSSPTIESTVKDETKDL